MRDSSKRGPDDEAQQAFNAVDQALAGRWKALVLWMLLDGSHRYGDLATRMPKVTPKVLTQQLRELERHGFVSRWCASNGPRHVEYALTPLGRSLEQVLTQLHAWGSRYRDGVPDQAMLADGIVQHLGNNRAVSPTDSRLEFADLLGTDGASRRPDDLRRG